MTILTGGIRSESNIIGIDDGYGVIGCGFICIYCKEENLFVNGSDDSHTCSNCKKENEFDEEYDY